jgi:GNAT superfamily N-acetyltransferase
MTDTFRRANAEDKAECGRICYEAFTSINAAHNFPPDFPSQEVSVGLIGMLIGHPGFYNVVAERDGRIIGSNFMDERSPVLGIGPITVDPAVQNQGVGRRLMQDVMDRGAARNAPGLRLVQAGFHNRSLCLYTTLGFHTREPLSVMQGPPLNRRFAGYAVRAAHSADIDACNALCRDVHGFDRGGELADAIGQNTATVVEHLGRITGYATFLGLFGHSVARSNRDLMALIAAAPSFPGTGFLLPTRNHELFAWCLASGLRLVEQMTLMTIGLYNEPDGAWLSSILY